MCSLRVTAESFSGLGMVLTGGGRHPLTDVRLSGADAVRIAKTVMLTCGIYDGSSEFAVRVGLPSKSGGGIVSLVERRMGINIGGRHMLEFLSKRLGVHMFAG